MAKTTARRTRSLADLMTATHRNMASLAAATGVSLPSAYAYRSGSRDVPEARLGPLAAALGVSLPVLRRALAETARRKALRDDIGE